MKKLTDLRDHLLTFKDFVDEGQLMVFGEKGKVRFARQPTFEQNKGFFDELVDAGDQSFGLRYTAHVIFSNSTADLKALIYLVLLFLQENEPAMSEEHIDFHVDIIDAQRADISLQFELNDYVDVQINQGTTKLDAQPDNDAFDHKLATAAALEIVISQGGEPGTVITVTSDGGAPGETVNTLSDGGII